MGFGWTDVPEELRQPGRCAPFREWLRDQACHWAVKKSLMARYQKEFGCAWTHADYVEVGADAS